jgi:anti-sigma regulatory factor (Ser/Thr protein kinase)
MFEGGPASFRHEAMLYAGDNELIARLSEFVGEGVRSHEPTLVVLAGGKLERLRAELGTSDGVRFADMDDVGRNPARIISAWHDFAREFERAPRLRGVGEPITSALDDDALVECQRHESLLNLAFVREPLWLVCPYDTSTLGGEVVEEAFRSHPYVCDADRCRPSTEFAPPTVDFEAQLSAPPISASGILYDTASLHEMRTFVSTHAAKAGFGDDRVEEIVLAANEIATNSLRHAGGHGALRVWAEGDSFVCEFSDTGHIRGQPLVGRLRPRPGQEGGHGLWLANQLCDLVQVRSGQAGTVVRLHFSR